MSNIQVVVRCRGRNSQEIAAKSPIVVELTNDNYSITEPYITINQGYTRATAQPPPIIPPPPTPIIQLGQHRIPALHL